MARKVMLIRHGEKPDKDGSVHGISEKGLHDPDELTVRGWQRSGALIRFFAPPHGMFSHAALATPDKIFACMPHGHVKSVRSAHTVEPLAKFLNKTVDLSHERGAEDQLAQAVIASQGVVLIAWEHDAIPKIAARIMSPHKLSADKWPDSRFDIVWVLDQSSASGWALTQAPQLVLPGDRSDVIEFFKTA